MLVSGVDGCVDAGAGASAGGCSGRTGGFVAVHPATSTAKRSNAVKNAIVIDTINLLLIRISGTPHISKGFYSSCLV
jgi:hypothetical protein